MTVRETYMKDYLITDCRKKELVQFCRNADNEDLIMILQAAIQSNSGLASKLFITLTEGCGYDKICTFASVPARKTDYQGYAISSIKIVSAILNGCLQQAMKNGLIERNPVKLAELPRQTGTKKERTAMTKEQQDLFMKYAEESYLYHFFSVMLRTGMRKGEMQGLKYSDIDKKQNVIHVRRTLKYIEGKGYFEDTPKTRTSTRDIPLTAAITEHIEAQRKYWGFKVVRMDQYLFCNENGDPISRERIQGEIDRIIKRIKSDGYDFPRITSHVFRHTFATRAIEAGMPPQVLKTILGHSSLAMTMDLYSHVLPDTKADEMQKIANVF